eukprot:CAMPEP_0113474184 /NCGR_PEP_ID=MMETSP0014_2-20120614/18445_1 /TAXON_ID=2857 /ORGANISM="Nitzschia sp." /LENGTH=778 /DNA_ID=CAMNT_0000367007 /DNA_START=194 /DNA_END=2530 /DNA_ORIENTATION=- /assembly_acc=CAM_ASM_000159
MAGSTTSTTFTTSRRRTAPLHETNKQQQKSENDSEPNNPNQSLSELESESESSHLPLQIQSILSDRMDSFGVGAPGATAVGGSDHVEDELPSSIPTSTTEMTIITATSSTGSSDCSGNGNGNTAPERRQPRTERLGEEEESNCLRLRLSSSGSGSGEQEITTANIRISQSQAQEKTQPLGSPSLSSSPTRHSRSKTLSSMEDVPFSKTFNSLSERGSASATTSSKDSNGDASSSSNDNNIFRNMIDGLPNEVGCVPTLRRCRSSEPVFNHTTRPLFDDDEEEDDDDEDYSDDADDDFFHEREINSINPNGFQSAFFPISRNNSLVDRKDRLMIQTPQHLMQDRHSQCVSGKDSNDDADSPSTLSAASTLTFAETWFTPKQKPTKSFDWFESSPHQNGNGQQQELRQRKHHKTNILCVETNRRSPTNLLGGGDVVRTPMSSSSMMMTTPSSVRSYNSHQSHHRRQRSYNRQGPYSITTGGKTGSSRFVIPIEHPLKILWDVVTVVLSFVHTYLTHAAIRDRNVSLYQSPFTIFCDVWFLIDILLNFVTERRTANGDGILRSHRAICARYLTSWFAIDAFSLFPWEAIYVKPIIEAANRRNWIEKLPRRYKAVLRVTQRLRGRHFRWFGTVARHTKEHGVGSRRLLHLIIKYAPKYFMFLRNMKAIVAMRLLRFVHWIRRLVQNNITHGDGGGAAAAATAQTKSDASTRSLSTREFEDEDLLLDGEGDHNRLGSNHHMMMTHSNDMRAKVEVVYQDGWEIGLVEDYDYEDDDDDDDGVPL